MVSRPGHTHASHPHAAHGIHAQLGGTSQVSFRNRDTSETRPSSRGRTRTSQRPSLSPYITSAKTSVDIFHAIRRSKDRLMLPPDVYVTHRCRYATQHAEAVRYRADEKRCVQRTIAENREVLIPRRAPVNGGAECDAGHDGAGGVPRIRSIIATSHHAYHHHFILICPPAMR